MRRAFCGGSENTAPNAPRGHVAFPNLTGVGNARRVVSPDGWSRREEERERWTKSVRRPRPTTPESTPAPPPPLGAASVAHRAASAPRRGPSGTRRPPIRAPTAQRPLAGAAPPDATGVGARLRAPRRGAGGHPPGAGRPGLARVPAPPCPGGRAPAAEAGPTAPAVDAAGARDAVGSSSPWWPPSSAVPPVRGSPRRSAPATAPPRAPPVSVGQETPGPALAGGAQIPTIVKSVLPEVVSIDAKGPGTGGKRSVRRGRSEDQGTGMIISNTGEVITNNHVISGATTITVTLYGQTAALPATLVGADPSSDMALLQDQVPAVQPPGRDVRGLDQAPGR